MSNAPDEPLRVGAERTADVQRLAHGGDALCRVDGRTVFVPGALPGERVRIAIESVDGNAGRGRLLAVERPAPERTPAGCEVFGTCGGCRLQNLDAAARVAWKRGEFERIAGAQLRGLPELGPTLAPPDWRGERTRIALRLRSHGRSFTAGLPARHGDGLVSHDACPVTDPAAWQVAQALRDEVLRRDLRAVRALVVQAASQGGLLQATLVSEAARLPHAQRLATVAAEAGATGVALNIHDSRPEHLLGRRTTPLHGRSTLEERVADVELRLTATTHTEGLRWGSAALVDAVRRLATPEPVDLAVDLFSGSGLLALALASRAERVIGVDHSISAVHDARAAASANGFDVTFHHSRVLEALPVLERPRPDVVVVDPPRSGLDDATVAGIGRLLAPDAICVVGRDAGAFAREVARFVALGFEVRAIETLDADPQSTELHAVARLTPR